MGPASRQSFALLSGAALACTLVLAVGIREPDLRYLVPISSAGLLAVSVALHRTSAIRMPELLGIAILARLLLFPLAPSLSDDVFRYIWDGILQVQGINPYALVPSDPALSALHGEPVFALLNSRAYFSVYPPVSQLVFVLGAAGYGYGWEVSYFVIKGILVGSEVVALVLLSRLSSPALMALYALNPVVLIEAAAQPHTENLLVLALAVTFWAVKRRNAALAAVAVTFGAWVKLVPVLLIPFVLRRVGWRMLGAVVVVSILLFLPFWHPDLVPNLLASLNLYVHLFEFNAGPYYLVKWVMNGWLPGGRSGWGHSIGPAFRVLFLMAVPALYVLDRRYRWRLPTAVFFLFGTYLFFSTTLHPWYALGLLATVPLLPRIPWGWLWLTTVLTGTYLFYTVGWYWPFIWVGWSGWLVLSLRRSTVRSLLAALLRERARRKTALLRPFLGGRSGETSVLDLGAGDGYVGETLALQCGAHVHLTDVVDFNRTDLPLHVYDGSTLPYADRSFDVVLLVFVLHHCRDSARTIGEALRVARERVVVLESVYDRPLDRWLLEVLDRLANRWRSGGLMRPQEEHLAFRKAEEWIALFHEKGARIAGIARKGRWIHRQLVLDVVPPSPHPEVYGTR